MTPSTITSIYMPFIALRFEHLRWNNEEFHTSLCELENTKYSLWAKDEYAPWVTHCISAVRYIIRKSTGFNLPHEYIWDFVTNMLYNWVAWSHLIPLKDAERWDLVFFHRKSLAHRVYMISHVWLFVDDMWNYFHSSPKGGKIESVNSAINRGTIVDCRLAMKRTDLRFDFTLEKVPL